MSVALCQQVVLFQLMRRNWHTWPFSRGTCRGQGRRTEEAADEFLDKADAPVYEKADRESLDVEHVVGDQADAQRSDVPGQR
jgi:hypothetical protein